MWIHTLNKLSLICPACRVQNNEGLLELSALELRPLQDASDGWVEEGFLVCQNAACASHYPIVAGIPVILKSPAATLSTLPQDILQAINHPQLLDYVRAQGVKQGSEAESDAWLDSYLYSHYEDKPAGAMPIIDKEGRVFRDEITSMLERLPNKTSGIAIDLGCSVGGYSVALAKHHALCIGVDTNLASLYKAVQYQRKRTTTDQFKEENVCFMAADILDPPFLAECIDTILALNVIDNVRWPLIALGQMDALLKPGGDMIFSSPYAWREDITPREEWLQSDNMDSADLVKKIFMGEAVPQLGLHYRILDELPNVPWLLQHGPRHVSYFSAQVLRLKKGEI